MDSEKIETLRIVSRGYELASTGSLPVATYLRYLEHVRWRTISRSQKLPMRKFFVLGVVRAQVLELFRNVGFDVELELSMWVSRVGRTSIDYSHEIVRVQDGGLVARSTATIVALDPERRPAPIGEGAREYLVERETVRQERWDGAIPDGAWTGPVDLRPSDQDLQQHVNHARYAEFVEDARWFAARAGAYGAGEWDGPARRFAIAYEHEARVGDAVTARTFVAPGRERTVDVVLTKDGGTVVARSRMEIAHRDLSS